MQGVLNKNEENNRPGEGSLSVQILSPNGVIWQGNAYAVSSENSQGPFDLLPEHAHFISMVNKKPIQVSTESGAETFTFDTSVIRLIDNEVKIFVDIT